MLWSAHLSMLFCELPAPERPAAAAAAGFRAVESWWPPTDDPLGWADAAAALGLSVPLLNCDAGDLRAGDRGFLNLPERRDDVRDALLRALAVARRCDAGALNVLPGLDTGDRPRRAQLADVASALRELVALAGETGPLLLVEPINAHDVPGYLVPTPAAAADLVEAVGSDRVRILYDAYHAARAGGDPCRDVVELLPLIGHVQFADCPGRGAPGTGTLDLHALVDTLGGAGYEGAIGLEYDPAGPTLDTLGFLAW